MALLQENRVLGVDTPLGDDVLLLTAFHGTENISRLFRYELDLISDDDSIAANDIVGQNVTFSVKLTDDSPRFFNGFVSELVAGDTEDGRRNYRATVVPWLWFLSQTADCRIFQKKTAVEIIEEIFNDLGFSDYETSEIKGEHKERDYCVQYRETDFNFVSRLMETEGIFYYFRHEDGKHTLVLADQTGAYKDCPENEVDYPPSQGQDALTDHIKSWSHRFGFISGKWAHTDYNFETPSTNLMSNSKSIVSLPGIDKYEIYDYPGEYLEKGDGDTEVKLRMEEEEVEHETINGSSLCKTFTPGGKFKITGQRAGSDENQTFVITSVQHSATETLAYESGGATSQDYNNSFTCIPDSIVYRPARVSPEPMISGVQTAVVVGPSGEEIYTDEYGRVKVQFPWDREGKKDESSSCWIRVAHNAAGKNWGFVSIPRIGQEVVIDFLEGDPDRPLVVGLVYNAEQMPPFGLPDSKTKTGMKSQTHKGDGYNEFSMDDTAGKELITVHGQYDMDTTIEHDQRLTVHNNRSATIDVDDTESVGGNQTIDIAKDRTEKVEGSENYRVTGERKETVSADRHLNVGGDHLEAVGGDKHVQVGGDQNAAVGGTLSLSTGSNLQQAVGSNCAIDAGQEIHLKAGMSIVLEAGMEITLKAGASFIKLGPDGVTIAGTPMTKINSGGAAGNGGGCNATSPTEASEAE